MLQPEKSLLLKQKTDINNQIGISQDQVKKSPGVGVLVNGTIIVYDDINNEFTVSTHEECVSLSTMDYASFEIHRLIYEVSMKSLNRNNIRKINEIHKEVVESIDLDNLDDRMLVVLKDIPFVVSDHGKTYSYVWGDSQISIDVSNENGTLALSELIFNITNEDKESSHYSNDESYRESTLRIMREIIESQSNRDPQAKAVPLFSGGDGDATVDVVYYNSTNSVAVICKKGGVIEYGDNYLNCTYITYHHVANFVSKWLMDNK